MAGSLVDAGRAAHGTGPETLDGRPFVDESRPDDEVIAPNMQVLLGVGHRAVEDLLHDLRGTARRELQDRARLGHGLAADEVDDQPRLARAHAHVARYGSRFHYLLPFFPP